MGKTIIFDPDDGFTRRRTRPTPADIARREAGWRNLLDTRGTQDGSVNDVYRPSPNYDHNGRPVSPEERQQWRDSQGIVNPDDPTTDG